MKFSRSLSTDTQPPVYLKYLVGLVKKALNYESKHRETNKPPSSRAAQRSQGQRHDLFKNGEGTVVWPWGGRPPPPGAAPLNGDEC